jgi:hypothetical protein
MKEFEQFTIDPTKCLQEITDLKHLLTADSLAERKTILPFFKKRKHLSAYIGSFNSNNIRSNLLAHEFTLGGDFVCDLVIGDSISHAFCFVEFENATKDSIFKKTNRTKSEWSQRLERGFGQLLDWMWKINEQRTAGSFFDLFGSNEPNCVTLLIIGRKKYLTKPTEKERFYWRRNNLIIGGKPIICMTYDDLLEALESRMAFVAAMANNEANLEQVTTGGH